MKIYPILSFILILSLLVACDTDESSIEEPITENFLFEDGFETMNNSFDELFPSDGSRWTTTQQTNASNATNDISITTAEFSEGRQALRILARESDAQLSKMDIEKNGLNIKAGDEVTIKADFYISGSASLQNLLLVDLECCSCWDPSVGNNYGAENQCPGVRLIMSGADGYLSIERGKISGTTLQQTDIPFPRNQWVSIQWELTLSDDESGLNRLLINGTEAINANAMNMPNASIFSDEFADQGIDFTLQEPVFYERVQVGATANPTAGDVELYVDDFSIRVE